MDFDTGSSDLFLPSIDCDSSCLGHETYDPSSSSTSRDLNKTFEIAYGDGSSTKGEQYTDKVMISGLTVRVGGVIFQLLSIIATESGSLAYFLTVRQMCRRSERQPTIPALKSVGSLLMA